MRVLFVCHGNVARSQMAAAFFNQQARGDQATSAGTHVGAHEGAPLHRHVIDCMRAVGLDLSGARRHQLRAQMAKTADTIVAITPRRNLPRSLRNSPKLVFWRILNPKGRSFRVHGDVRDQIRTNVRLLIKQPI